MRRQNPRSPWAHRHVGGTDKRLPTRMTRAEQLADLDRIQRTRPLKPPPGRPSERLTRAAAVDAAKWNRKQIAPEVSLDFITNQRKR